jgi:hypothetical protein
MPHHILNLLRDALVHYGYWAVAAMLLLESAGLPLPGETILLLAGFLAYSEHELRLPWVIVVGIVATTLGGELGFAFGRHGGRPLIERYQHVFSIRARERGAGGTAFRALRGGYRFPGAVSFRDARAGLAAGGSAPHAMAEVCPIQLPGSLGLGDSDLRGRIFVWPPLGPASL